MEKPKGLLDLPPELWSRICILAATDEQTPIVLYDDDPILWMGAKSRQPGITQTCLAIRAETLPAYYEKVGLIIQGNRRSARYAHWGHWAAWFRAIGPVNRSYIHRLYLAVTLYPDGERSITNEDLPGVLRTHNIFPQPFRLVEIGQGRSSLLQNTLTPEAFYTYYRVILGPAGEGAVVEAQHA